MSANHEAAKKEKLTEKFLLSLVSSITTTICSHNYHLLLLLLFITSSLKLSHLPTYQHHSYLELAISLEVKTIYSCHVSIPPFMEHPLSNFQNPNYEIVQTLVMILSSSRRSYLYSKFVFPQFALSSCLIPFTG